MVVGVLWHGVVRRRQAPAALYRFVSRGVGTRAQSPKAVVTCESVGARCWADAVASLSAARERARPDPGESAATSARVPVSHTAAQRRPSIARAAPRQHTSSPDAFSQSVELPNEPTGQLFYPVFCAHDSPVSLLPAAYRPG